MVKDQLLCLLLVLQKKWNMTEEDKVTNAEVLWTLKLVKSAYSFNSCDDISEIFQNAFSDSQIAKSFTLSSTKVAYELCHGLGPFFHGELVSSIINSENFFSLSFDEATTDAGKKQLDIHIRFWNEETGQIACQFLRAFELGRATAEILKEKLLLALTIDKLPLSKLLAISSDGPPVNHKCLNEIDKVLQEKGYCPLIKVGTCNLHIAHNSFRHAIHSVSHWDIEDFLDAVFKFLHRFPARKEDFQAIQVEVGTKEQMLMMFVSNRWLTLVPVISKIIEQWTALKEYFLKYIPNSKNKQQCQTQSYRFIKSLLSDASTLPRLHFLKSVGESFDKFMTFMQMEEPLIHVLYDELCNLIKSLMIRIVKPEKLDESASKFQAIDLKNFDNILPLEKIDVGFLAKKEALKLNGKDKKAFYMDAKALIIAIISYLLDHLPLNNVILKNIHCLHPFLQCEQRSLDCFQKVIEQFPSVVKKEDVDKLREEWKLYMLEEIDDSIIDKDKPSGCKGRIDNYWSIILKKKNVLGDFKYPLLSKFIKAVLSLYHGQADIERGFSINHQFVTTSRAALKEKTINSLRTVESEIRMRGGDVTKVPVSPQCLKAFRSANKVYKEYLEDCKKEESEKKVREEKRQCETNYKSLQEEKKKLQEAVNSSHSLIGEANYRLSKAIQSSNMAEVVTAQALLQSGHKLLTEKGEELKAVERQLSSLTKKFRK